MSKRLPTAEERILWREINKFTRVAAPETQMAIDDVSNFSQPAPVTGAMRGLNVAPVPVAKKKSPPPKVALPAREAKKRAGLHPHIDATLDLHGYGRLDAYALVQAFVARHAALGHRHLLIITGKGRGGEAGVLRTELPHWLNELRIAPHIAAFFHATDRDGGNGVMHVLLKAALR